MTAPITIYGPPFSRSGRVIWAAKELGLPHQVHSLEFSELKSPEFLKINPMGEIPAIKDGDLVMAESFAINLYLAKKAGGPLAPQSLTEEAVCLQWTLWAATALEPHLPKIMGHRMGLPPEMRNEAVALKAIEGLMRVLRVLDQKLEGRRYLLGDRFSIADINVAGAMGPFVACEVDLAETPSLSSWVTDCLGRPYAAGLANKVSFPPAVIDAFIERIGLD